MAEGPETYKQALMAGINANELAMTGFERLQRMLEVIKHIAEQHPGGEYIATICEESLNVAAEFLNMADVEREQCQMAHNALQNAPLKKAASHG